MYCWAVPPDAEVLVVDGGGGGTVGEALLPLGCVTTELNQQGLMRDVVQEHSLVEGYW